MFALRHVRSVLPLVFLTLSGCGLGESTGSPCSSGWIGYPGNPNCYCAATDTWLDCDETNRKVTGIVAREGAAWDGSVNGPFVFDAGQEIVWFEVDAPHLLRVGEATVFDLRATQDGQLWHADDVIGAIVAIEGRDGLPVAALVGQDGTLLDLAVVDGTLIVRSSGQRATLAAGRLDLEGARLSMAADEGILTGDAIEVGRVPFRGDDIEVNLDLDRLRTLVTRIELGR